MCHNFFIHSSVDGHLGCFHVLAIVNSAAVNTGVHESFRTVVFSEYPPGTAFLPDWETQFTGGKASEPPAEKKRPYCPLEEQAARVCET